MKRSGLGLTGSLGVRAPVLAAVLVAAVVAACGGGVAGPTPRPGATSFQEFRTANCAAWESMFLAVGNPDTASGSELSLALDDAIASGDLATADLKAAAIRAELEAGRGHAAVAGAWPPAAVPMTQLDRVFVAFEAYVEAERAAAGKGLSVAKQEAQAALMATGAGEAWRLLLTPETWAEVNAARPANVRPERCGDLPISF
ncbi:MAG: hypothetical protein AB1736_02755 [Chloroflexota bacterium]